jgi:hypothetical protein
MKMQPIPTEKFIDRISAAGQAFAGGPVFLVIAAALMLTGCAHRMADPALSTDEVIMQLVPVGQRLSYEGLGRIDFRWDCDEDIMVFRAEYSTLDAGETAMPLHADFYFPPDHDFAGKAPILIMPVNWQERHLHEGKNTHRARMFASQGIVAILVNTVEFSSGKIAESLMAFIEYADRNARSLGISTSSLAFFAAHGEVPTASQGIAGLPRNLARRVVSFTVFNWQIPSNQLERLPPASYRLYVWEKDLRTTIAGFEVVREVLRARGFPSELSLVPSGGHNFDLDNSDPRLRILLEQAAADIIRDIWG